MKIGFVNGCFDVLHIGHIRMLRYAKSQCQRLYVAIDSDSRVKASKGKSRPINCQADRAEFLVSLNSVDDVMIFNSDEELTNLVKQISPDIMVVGSDYKNKTVIGSEYAKQLLFFNRIAGYSTSKIVKSSSDR